MVTEGQRHTARVERRGGEVARTLVGEAQLRIPEFTPAQLPPEDKSPETKV